MTPASTLVMPRFMHAAIAAAALATLALTPAPSGAAMLDTGFEQPTYTTGALDGQDSWDASAHGEDAAAVIAGGGSLPDAPEGSQMARIRRDQTDPIRTFSATPVTDPFNVSFSIAHRNLADGNEGGGDNGIVYVNDPDDQPFGGILGAFHGGELAYRDGGTWVTLVSSPAEDTFYHFEATLTPATSTWDLRVTDDSSNVIADEQGLGLSSGASSFTRVRLLTTGADDQTLFADDIRVAIPEPASAGLLGLGLAVLGYGRRRRPAATHTR